MTTVSTRKSAKPKAPPPPTIMTLTLNADGTAMLLTKRGDLACAHSFTYRDLKEIVTALKHGAAQLVEIEQNPPSDPPSTPPISSSDQPSASITTTDAQATNEADSVAVNSEATETQTNYIEADEASESPNTSLLAEVDDLPSTANEPLSGVTRPASSLQMPLL